ncbi:Zinc finger BED domain-containing protein 4-like [Oopsacas minuta]|uniref:Zinc finger BED domain-containing protein 4-like n=1 Tax=Oopsacas minuta TaxID=111878 RepID=A0AAV7JHY9_9METZ|nr:Zinc finger BED domain-containing protein 4-like [Oopsacas minuta]
MAAILDPRWKLDWYRPDEVTRCTNFLIEKVSLQYGPNEMDELETTASTARKRCRLFNFMVSQSILISNSKGPSQTQVEIYLSQPTISENAEPLIYWEKEFPQLTKVALCYLATPLLQPLLKDCFR